MTNLLFNCPTGLPAPISAQAGHFLRELVCLLIRQQRIEQRLFQLSAKKDRKQGDKTALLAESMMNEQAYQECLDEDSEEEEKKGGTKRTKRG